MLTKEQARMICEAHEIFAVLGDDEERELMEENNPDLLDAYCELHKLAVGADTVTDGGNGCEA
jgi:hypothetical protein